MRRWMLLASSALLALALWALLPRPSWQVQEAVAQPVLSQTLEQAYQRSVAASVRVNIGDSGIGSGFFISPDGLLLTAAHVALGDGDLSVTTADGAEYAAQLVGYDELLDLALLKVQGSGFAYLPLSNAAAKVGDAVVAIGNSRGRFDAGKTGRITALNARLDATFPEGLTATTMPLAPGDSGGPVLNAQGYVVGVSVAISNVNGEFRSYFMPVVSNSATLAQLKAGTKRGVPILGVNVTEAERYLSQQGVLVTDVVEGLGAQKAGLQVPQVQTYRDERGRLRQNIAQADVIVAIDGRTVRSVSELVGYLRSKKVGDQVSLRVLRGEQTLELSVVLSSKSAN